MPGATFLQHVIPWAIRKFDFDADAFVHELVDSIIGDNYPVPDRMLVHNEQIVREYLQWAMCGEPRPAGTFDLYAVEGGTAAMCYIFKSLKANRLLNPGDTIALATPIFTPYLEMPHLEDYDLKMVFIQARQEQRWQFSDEDLAPLLDPAVKAFFVVNPGNPYAVALSRETIASIGRVLKKRPDLMLLTDDVYGTFVPGFRSLLGEFPKNTIGVYSYSKYFGCTGWRLGVIALHEDNVFDEKIAAHPEAVAQALDKRYGPLTLEPRTLKFIDRIVADSRDVALNHTAGLSLPQQVMMALFSLAELHDEKKVYQQACIDIVRKRVDGDDRGARDRDRPQSAVRLVLRPHRFRVLAPQVRRRGRRAVGQGERPSARHRVPPRRGPRHRPAQRRRLRGARLVGARLVREPRRRRVRRHRPRGARRRSRLRDGVPGVAGGGRGSRRGARARREPVDDRDALIGVLREHPEVTFFLVLGIGYLLGKLKLGSFTLGAVTGTLLAGVVVGQLGVQVSDEVKQCFFLLFLFSIGFRTGPQFFRGLKSDGLQQAALAAIVATTGLVVAYIVSRLLGYDAGTAAGVIAGSLTESATIGTASDAIARLGLPPADALAMTNRIPVAFAVTYLIGVVGAAWFLAQLAPRLMSDQSRGGVPALRAADAGRRTAPVRGAEGHRVSAPTPCSRDRRLIGRRVRDLEQRASDARLFVERIRRGDRMLDPDETTTVCRRATRWRSPAGGS